MALRMVEQIDFGSCCLTFELSGRRRQDARPGLAKMYRVPPDRAWWPAVGAPLERGVRPHFAYAAGPARATPATRMMTLGTASRERDSGARRQPENLRTATARSGTARNHHQLALTVLDQYAR
jgi:hypothetical protein